VDTTDDGASEKGKPQNIKGELCLRGPGMIKDYYKSEEVTAEAIDADNWYHTGDIAELVIPDNTIRILDRVKSTFKLSQGEFIVPEKIENIYKNSEYVADIFLDGDSFQAYCIVIIVPVSETVMKLGQTLKITGNFEELCKNEIIKKKILESLWELGT